MKTSLFPTWIDLLAIVGMFGVSGGLAAFVVSRTGTGEPGWATFWVYTISFALTIAFALLLARRRGGVGANGLYPGFRGFDPPRILWGLVGMLAAGVVIEPLIELFPDRWYAGVEERLTTGGWALFTAVVMAPVCEEILFRGIIQQGLTRRWGPWGGILFASALFGIIHCIPQQIVAGFALGIVIGFVYYRTRSLLSVIVLHAVNNGLAAFWGFWDSAAGSRSLSETIGNTSVYRWIYGACAVLLILFLVGAAAAIRRARRHEIADDGENSPG
jgi:membrane protease YdiL (CAAX protease family)